MNRQISLTAMTLACIGGSAMAQSGVTIFGTVDLMAARLTGAQTGVNANDRAMKRIESGGMTTSTFGFRGTEDLGDGLSAVFELSGFLRADTGESGRNNAIGAPVNVAADQFWSRTSWVGLSSKALGRVRFGNGTSLLYLNSITSNAFADSMVFSPTNLVMFVGGPLSGGTNWTNQVMFDTANFGGFTASVAISAAETQGGRNVAGRVSYSAGPVSASFAYQDVKKNPLTFAEGTSPNNTKTWQMGGSYDFGVTKLFAHVARIQNDGTETSPLDIEYRVWDVSASIPVSNGNVLIGYASRSTSDPVGPIPAAAAGGNKERKVFSMGYDYFLSKRTDIYAVTTRDATKTNTLQAPPSLVSASAANLGVGIRHRF